MAQRKSEGGRATRRNAQRYAWIDEPHASAVAEAATEAALEVVRVAGEHDPLARAAAIVDVLRGVRKAKALKDPAARKKVIDALRARLVQAFESEALVDAAAVARSSVALELYVSLCDSPTTPARHYEGVADRVEEIALRVGLRNKPRRALGRQLALAAEGDLGFSGRPPYVVDALFDATSSREATLAGRAVRLARHLLKRGVALDAFLWFWILGAARDAAARRTLFSRATRNAVDDALFGVLRDDTRFDAMLADREAWHARTLQYVLGETEKRGLAALAPRARKADTLVVRSGGAACFTIADALGAKRAFALNTPKLAAGVLEETVPIASTGKAELLDAAAQTALVARFGDGAIEQHDLEKVRGDALDELIRGKGPVVFVDAGAYLGAERPSERALRRRASHGGVSAIRFAAIRAAQNILASLKPGDVFAAFGRGGVAYFRGVTWISFELGTDKRPRLLDVAHRLGFPELASRFTRLSK